MISLVKSLSSLNQSSFFKKLKILNYLGIYFIILRTDSKIHEQIYN